MACTFTPHVSSGASFHQSAHALNACQAILAPCFQTAQQAALDSGCQGKPTEKLCRMMYEQGGGHGPPPFSVVVVTCGSDEELPCLDAPDPTDPTEGPFLVGMAGISYKVQIHWNEEVDLGLCQVCWYTQDVSVRYEIKKSAEWAGAMGLNGFCCAVWSGVGLGRDCMCMRVCGEVDVMCTKASWMLHHLR